MNEEEKCSICGDGQFVQWECPQCGRQVNEEDYAAGLAAGEKGREELMVVVKELAGMLSRATMALTDDKYPLMDEDFKRIGDDLKAASALLSRQAPTKPKEEK